MSDDFLDKFFKSVDDNVPMFKEQLSEAVAIPSVSAQLDDHLNDIVKMMKWTKDYISRLGGKATLVPNPVGTAEKQLPPILLGEFLVDPAKKTVCVYGHLDVQPAKKEDGWNTEPFVLTEKDGKLYGRGSTDDKGWVDAAACLSVSGNSFVKVEHFSPFLQSCLVLAMDYSSASTTRNGAAY
jgi:nonspecific dipeptidase